MKNRDILFITILVSTVREYIITSYLNKLMVIREHGQLWYTL